MACMPGRGHCCYSMSSCSNCDSSGHELLQTMNYTDSSFISTDTEREIDVDKFCGSRATSGRYYRFPSFPDARYIYLPRDRRQVSDSETSSLESDFYKPSATKYTRTFAASESSISCLPAPENSPTSGYCGDYQTSIDETSFQNSQDSWCAAPTLPRFCLIHMNSDSPCSVTTGRRSSISESDSDQSRRQSLTSRDRESQLQHNTYLQPLGVRPPCIGKEGSPLHHHHAAPAVRLTPELRTEELPRADPRGRVSAWLADIPEHTAMDAEKVIYNDGAQLNGYLRMSARRSHRPNSFNHSSSLRSSTRRSNLNLTRDTELSDVSGFMKVPLCRAPVTKKLTQSRHRVIAKKLKNMCKQLQRKGSSGNSNIETLAVI